MREHWFWFWSERNTSVELETCNGKDMDEVLVLDFETIST